MIALWMNAMNQMLILSPSPSSDDHSTRSKHTSDGSHKGEGDDTAEEEDDEPGQGPRTSKPSGAGGPRPNAQKSKPKAKKGGKGRKKGRR